MNGSLALVDEMKSALEASEFANTDVLVCPPFPYLGSLASDGFILGAQNHSKFDAGAHTGETSAAMLKEFGCRYVIVGHSERREDNNESNLDVAEKVETAINAGLIPILCVGESEQTRDAGKENEFIAEQLDAVLKLIGIANVAKIVIAYEPIWAIGTGKTASPEQAQAVHEFIRSHLTKENADVAASVQILYGGSVKASNAATLFSQPDIDGGLIGGASLNAEEFLAICQAANA